MSLNCINLHKNYCLVFNHKFINNIHVRSCLSIPKSVLLIHVMSTLLRLTFGRKVFIFGRMIAYWCVDENESFLFQILPLS